MRILPDNILRAMAPADRKALGKAGRTQAEAEAVFVSGQERELKALAVNECLRRGAYIFEQPMHQRTRGKRGTPDILGIYRGAGFAVELKCNGNTLSPEQAKEAARIKMAGGRYAVAYCLRDVQAVLNAIDLLQGNL